AGMTIRPRATSSRINSASRSSRWATKRISSVITPLRADSIWVMKKPLLRRGQQPPRKQQILAEQLGEQQQRYPGNKQKEREHAQSLHHVFQFVHPENQPDAGGEECHQHDQVYGPGGVFRPSG